MIDDRRGNSGILASTRHGRGQFSWEAGAGANTPEATAAPFSAPGRHWPDRIPCTNGWEFWEVSRVISAALADYHEEFGG
jgi:hypothetical protein